MEPSLTALLGGLSRSCWSWKQKLMASRRKPSTPRSSQNFTSVSTCSWTSGLWYFGSGWLVRKLCWYYCLRRLSQAEAERPNTDSQLLGGVPSGLGSAQTYQSARALVRD